MLIVISAPRQGLANRSIVVVRKDYEVSPDRAHKLSSRIGCFGLLGW